MGDGSCRGKAAEVGYGVGGRVGVGVALGWGLVQGAWGG